MYPYIPGLHDSSLKAFLELNFRRFSGKKFCAATVDSVCHTATIDSDCDLSSHNKHLFSTTSFLCHLSTMATRRTSTIGLTKVTADHPAIKGLNPSLQEIVLKNVADADKDADGRLDIDEFVALQVNTAMNVEAAAKKEARLENQVKYSLMTVVLSLLGNFGLIWAV